MFQFEFSEQQLLIQKTVRDFSEKVIKPIIDKYDESQEFPFEIINQLGEMGFMGILVPEKYSGSQLGYVEYALIVEELAKVDPSVSLTVAAHNGLCTNHILRFGNEEQKQKYLPYLATGKKIGAWALTEPFSGSDASALLTTAVREGDYYILNGTKN
ncbi:MAG: acyl-CoA dehydrogenase family protein, partial [Ignavibacteria bacterium]|nr:acyl-CoA dehydrogenase family protein [Ignavibacteria bacterium]